VIHAKRILLSILDRKDANLTADQRVEISKMLSFSPLKHVEKLMVEFEIDGRKAKAKLEMLDLNSKI